VDTEDADTDAETDADQRDTKPYETSSYLLDRIGRKPRELLANRRQLTRTTDERYDTTSHGDNELYYWAASEALRYVENPNAYFNL